MSQKVWIWQTVDQIPRSGYFRESSGNRLYQNSWSLKLVNSKKLQSYKLSWTLPTSIGNLFVGSYLLYGPFLISLVAIVLRIRP